jgi:hypothetical protein
MNVLTDSQLATRFFRRQLRFAEDTIVNAIVACQAIVAAFMRTIPYAKQDTVVTFRLAELDAGPKINYCAVECSA